MFITDCGTVNPTFRQPRRSRDLHPGFPGAAVRWVSPPVLRDGSVNFGLYQAPEGRGRKDPRLPSSPVPTRRRREGELKEAYRETVERDTKDRQTGKRVNNSIPLPSVVPG